LSSGDPKAIDDELERAVKAGHKGGWVVHFTMNRKPKLISTTTCFSPRRRNSAFRPGIHVSPEHSSREVEPRAISPVSLQRIMVRS
jgi:hypothetical protein